VALDQDEVRRIALLAHLDPDRLPLRSLRDQLEAILDHVALLDEVEASGVTDPASADPVAAMRDDRPAAATGAEDALRNAPDTEAGHFRVPRVIEG